MEEHDKWFEEFKKTEEYTQLEKNPVAYFSAEYALESDLPTYAGGLGILSGDHIREVAERNFPLIAVGLCYQHSQHLVSASQTDIRSKLKIVTNDSGEELIVSLPFEGRLVHARAWLWQKDNARVYLLDTDFEKNEPKDREITKMLYVEDRDMRLKQEILLGIGGFRLVAQIAKHASVYHMNEGHSAFLALELVRHEIEHQKVDFLSACDFAKKHLVFTNHTVVPAGQEHFDPKKVVEMIEHCARDICLNIWEIGTLGTLGKDPNVYSMTTMSFRLSYKTNSVSRIHLEKARLVWPEHAKMMDNVTNGINVKEWDRVGTGEAGELIQKRKQNKKELLELIEKETGEKWGEDDLILAWARRMVSYKQPLLIFDNIERIKKIIENSPIKIRFVFSGPTNHTENPFVEEIKKVASEKLPGSVIFLPNYNMARAKILHSGADIWLNTPITGNEACGTSGMKAGLNGTLNFSTRDGWIAETREEEVGWIVEDCQTSGELHEVLEQKIVPMFVEYQKEKEKSEWAKRMLATRNSIIKRFSTARMLREYIQKMYLPTLAQKHKHEID